MFKKLNHNGNNFEFPDNEKGKKDYEAFIAKFPDAIEVAITPDPDKEGKETPSQEIKSAPVEESVALEPTVTDSKPVTISSDLPEIKTGTVADTEYIPPAITSKESQKIIDDFNKISNIDIEFENKKATVEKTNRFKKDQFKTAEREEYNLYKQTGEVQPIILEDAEIKQKIENNRRDFMEDIAQDKRVQLLNQETKLRDALLNTTNELAFKINSNIGSVNNIISQYEESVKQGVPYSEDEYNIAKQKSQEIIKSTKQMESDLLRDLAILNKKNEFIDSFKRSYSNIDQLENVLKTTATDMVLGLAVPLDMLKSEEGKEKSYTKDLLNYRQKLQKESAEGLPKPIPVESISSLKDLVNWGSDSFVNFVPSGVMAFTGPIAPYVFELSGFGSRMAQFELEALEAKDQIPKLQELYNKSDDPLERAEIKKEIDKYNEALNVSDLKKLTVSGMYGKAERYTEMLTTVRIVKDLKSANTLFYKEGFAPAFKQAIKDIPTGGILEGGGEGLNNIIGNVADITILKEDKNAWDGVTESAAQGFFIGNGFKVANAGSLAKAYAYDVITDRQNKQEIESILKEINSLSSAFTEDTDINTKAEAARVIRSKIKEIGLNQDFTASQFLKLSEADQKAVFEADRQSKKVNERWKKIANSNLDETSKDLIRKDLESEFNSYQDKKISLLRKSNVNTELQQPKGLQEGDFYRGYKIHQVNDAAVKRNNSLNKLANKVVNVLSSEAETISDFINSDETLLTLNDGSVITKEDAQQINQIWESGSDGGFDRISKNQYTIIERAAVNNPSTALHEYFHAMAAEKGFTEEQYNKIKDDYIKLLKAKKESGELTEKQYNEIFSRLPLYDGTTEQAEELINLTADAVNLQIIKETDFNFLQRFANNVKSIVGSIIGKDEADNFNINTAEDAWNMVQTFSKDVLSSAPQKRIIGTQPEEEDKAVEQVETVIKESKSLTPEVTTDAENRIAELQKLKEETTAAAAKFGKEYIPSAKEQRLQKELLNIIDPVISKVAENRTKALYDKIAAEQKENVSREDYRESLKSNLATMAVNEFTQGKQDLETFIVNRGYLRANSLAKELGIESTEEFGGPGITSDITESVQVAAETAPEVEIEVAETKPTERLIEVKKQVLSESNQKELEDIVAEKLPELTPDQFTFKTLPNWAKQTLAKEIDIPVKKFEGSSNFTQAELNRVISFIENNIDTVRKALPDAAVLEGAPVSEGLIGTATGVPNNLLKDTNLYTRLERGTKKAGLVPFQKNKGIDNRSVLKAIGVIEGTRTAGPRDKQAQTAKGIINVLAKFITNQEIRKQADLTPQQKTDIETGKGSRLLFSKKDKNKFDEIFKDAPEEVQKYGMLLNVKPTNKAINSVLAKIEEELPIDVYDEYFEKYFKPFIEFRKFAQKQKWPWAEEKVKNTLITLSKNNPDLKLKNIKLNKDSQQIDVQFEQDGKLVLVEVKKNYQARISQIYLYEEADGKISTNKTADKIYEDEIIEADKTRNVLIDRIYRDYEKYVEKTTDKNGRVQYIVPIFAIEKARESLKKDKIAYETTIKMPIALAVSLYNTKANKAKNAKGLLISFGDLGTFYIGENKMQFPVPSFEKEGMELTVRIMDRYNPRQNPIVVDGEKFAAASLSRIAVNTLTPEAVKVLENTPSLSLQNEAQARAILKLSKSKTEAAVKNNLELSKSQRLPKDSTNEQVLAKMQELDNEANEARIKYSKSQNLDEAFNDIIEAKTGIETYKRFSPAKATVRGASKGKFNFFIPPSAEDFTGLLYKTLAKGKLGDRQMQWYKDNLLDPYARAMNDISAARVAMFEDYKALKEDLEIIPKDLKKKSVDEYTREQAVRVYIWNSQDNNIPGLFKTDQKELVDYVNNDPELRLFAEQLIAIQKTDGYSAPKEGWLTGSITTDLLDNVNSIKRKKYLEQWQNNVDEIFSEVNMNKLEAAFGKPYRQALENILTRMKTGRNKPFTSDSLAGRVTDWLNNSVGAIMFFNTRSAVLQTISSINFINWSDNNIYQAGKAFANQPQYWKDFKFLFNSDFLKERRGGSRFNVAESEIADAAKKGGARGVISKILQAGFLPTQVADSFAIASGGATFYRNRLNVYLKETDVDGNKIYTEAEAQEKAFLDFREIAEESQQSSRPDRISAQQAGPLGRTILAFANTPAQYARLTKKAASDLINGRGDAKTNFSKLLYYGFVQNLIFNMLQKATFLLAFGDEDEDEKKKEKAYLSTINGMADGLLRGIGVGGAAISTIKNVLIKISEDAADPVSDVLDFSPPISSKYDKLQRAYRTYKWNKKEILEKGFSLDNPAYLAGANVISATVNVPLDRVVRKVNNVVDATQENITPLERAMLAAGWSEWELGIQKPKEVKPKKKKKPKFKRVRKGDR